LDTVVFYGIAFLASSDPFMALHWPEIAALDYAFKLCISMVFFLPLYGILLHWLSEKILSTRSQQTAIC
ncbi:MAG TPA: hypothetical protein VJ969_12790, partial [Desulfopila sp.]|nr:hypothetical protein [Desulfopila sp.]